MANPFGEESQRNYGSTEERPYSPDRGADAKFERTRREIEEASQEIKKQTNELRQLLEAIGTDNDDMELRRHITNLRESAFLRVTQTSQLFMSFAGNTGQEMALRALQRQFSQIADQFSRVYEDIVGKLQEYPRPPRYSLRESKTYTSSGELAVEGENVRLTRADALEQEQEQYLQTEASYAENVVREMRELQENMVALHEIMTSMNRMVVEQGEDIDAIEAHVEAAATEVSQGNKELSAAVRYKRCSRKLTLVIIAVVTGVVIAIVLTIVIAVCVSPGDHCKSK